MPPEQARGLWEEVDSRSDLWACGATMFHALAGRAVHDGRTANEVLLAAMTMQAPAIATLVPAISEPTAGVIDRALAYTRAGRWPDGKSMQDAVRLAYHQRHGAPITAAPPLEVPESTRSEAVMAMLPTTGRPVANSHDPAVAGPRQRLAMFAAVGGGLRALRGGGQSPFSSAAARASDRFFALRPSRGDRGRRPRRFGRRGSIGARTRGRHRLACRARSLTPFGHSDRHARDRGPPSTHHGSASVGQTRGFVRLDCDQTGLQHSLRHRPGDREKKLWKMECLWKLSRRLAFCSPLLLVFSSQWALAKEPTKQECVLANESAQDLQRTGKLREARSKLVVCTASSCPGPVREDCVQRLADVDASTPTVVFDVVDRGGSRVDGARVRVDGESVDTSSGAAVPFNPGEHQLHLEAPGLPAIDRSLVLRPGDAGRRKSVTLDVPAPSTAVPAPTPPPPAPAPPSPSSAQRKTSASPLAA